jgi:hypothetical protein
MTDKILIVTAPDDSLLDGKRILAINLSADQKQLISDALKQVDASKNIIVYTWNDLEDIKWMLDKKHKSDMIIFNADSDNDLITGYMSAQSNSYYFGFLKSLQSVNNSAIYNVDQCIDLING